MELRVEVQGAKEVSLRYRGAAKVMTDELSKGILRLVIAGEGISKRKAPKWRGQLARSITHKVTPASGSVTGEWGTSLTYAKWKEKGTTKKNYFVPWKYIGAWASQHGFTAPKDPSKGGIRVTGNPQPFIKPAFDEIKPKVKAEMQAAVNRALARIKGGG